MRREETFSSSNQRESILNAINFLSISFLPLSQIRKVCVCVCVCIECLSFIKASQVVLVIKNLPANAGNIRNTSYWFDPWVRKVPWSRT